MAVAAELAERFRTDLASIWPYEGLTGYRLGLAVSGGADSLALTLLAHAALPGCVEAATVDHGLRPESAEEAALVARYCAELDIPHETLRVDVSPGNLQSRAREARYEALGEWVEHRGLEGLATGHQLDDQAETFVMRLNRGSGVSGLASIRALGIVPGARVRLVRPLLGWRREELAQIVSAQGWQAVADPSNEDTDFDRVRIRRALAGADWLDREAIGRSARHLAEADETIAWTIGREYNERVVIEGGEALYAALRTGIGGTIVRGGVIRAIFRHFGSTIDQGAAAMLVEALKRGEKINVAHVQAGVRDIGSERFWVFAAENARTN